MSREVYKLVTRNGQVHQICITPAAGKNDWRIYKFDPKTEQFGNWYITIGYRWVSVEDAIKFLEKKGFKVN